MVSWRDEWSAGGMTCPAISVSSRLPVETRIEWRVIAGVPWTTWLLLAAATLPSVALVLAFYLTQRAPR